MIISWHPLAHEDIREATAWHESQVSGLGSDFVDAVEKAVQRIAEFGETFAIYDEADQIRVCPLRRFPYHINFMVQGETAQILCVKHNRRHPDYGSDRR